MKELSTYILNLRIEQYFTIDKEIDDVCYTIFECEKCKQNKIEVTLLPIVDKIIGNEHQLSMTRSIIKNKIFDGDFDFLNVKSDCFCGNQIEISHVFYCYINGLIDTHVYMSRNEYDEVTEKYYLPKYFKFLIFDTETTGLAKNLNNPITDTKNWPFIVQLSWIIADIYGNIFEKENFVIKPDNFKIPIEAINIHKITNEIAFEIGVPISKALTKFGESINKVHYIVAHNLEFDYKVISCEFYRNKYSSEIKIKKKICTMKAAQNNLYTMNNKFISLTELYKVLFQEEITQKHNAFDDTMMTYKCFCKLIENSTIKFE
jgi:DNA polymerase III epsilon subunit-like protein